MAKSELARELDWVMASLKAELTGLGFAARGRDLRRETQDGLTQVINLQASQYGQKFTVNLGVFIPDMWKNYSDAAPCALPETVLESHCNIRTRLRRDPADREDPWWEAGQREATLADVAQRLRSFGVPLLDRFDSRDKIAARIADGSSDCVINPKMVLAMLCYERGDAAGATAHLRTYLARPDLRDVHSRYVRNVAARLGLALDAP